MTLARTEQAVTLSLNGEAVYQRTGDWSGDIPPVSITIINVAGRLNCNVVMTGD